MTPELRAARDRLERLLTAGSGRAVIDEAIDADLRTVLAALDRHDAIEQSVLDTARQVAEVGARFGPVPERVEVTYTVAEPVADLGLAVEHLRMTVLSAQATGTGQAAVMADELATLLDDYDRLHRHEQAREDWPYTPNGSPYQRLRDYAVGGGCRPSPEDVMELLRSFNAASAMNRVHREVISRMKRRREAARALAASGEPVPAQALLDALVVRRGEPADAGD